MESITTLEQRTQIKETIQLELLKRGFVAPIISFEELEGRSGNRLEFHTESFQTTPVIFQSIQVNNFSSSVTINKDEDGKETRRFWISVNVSYTHFGGGSNGCKLFDIVGKLSAEGDTVYAIQIR